MSDETETTDEWRRVEPPESYGLSYWTKPVGDGTVDLDLFDDEVEDFPPLAQARAENERLREALRQLLDRMNDRGSIGGVDSHLRTTWFSVAEVDRIRASLSETGGEEA